MALTKEQIEQLNRINSGAQRARLGNVLAKIEKIATAGNKGKELDLIKEELREKFEEELDLIREELNGMLEMIVGLEELKEKISTNKQSISAINKSLSGFESQLNKFIKSQKKAQTNSVS